MSTQGSSGAPVVVSGEDTSGGAVAPHAPTHRPATGSDPLATAAPGNIAIGDVPATGVGDSFARNDHTHGLPAPGAPAAQVFGAGATGAATSPARADHVHPMAAPALPASQVFGAGAAGAATTPARADHVHPMAAPALPQTQVFGAGSTGVDTTPSRADHVHPMAAPAAPVDLTALGNVPSSTGVATTPSRADHVHRITPEPTFTYRLSLTSEPVMNVDDETDGRFLFLQPMGGDQALMRTAGGVLYTMAAAGATLDLQAFPASAPGGVMDIFLRDVAGVPTLVRRNWTTPTVRAVPLATIQGMLVDSVNTADRYVATVKASDANAARTVWRTFPGPAVNIEFGIWNYYNRVPFPFSFRAGPATWASLVLNAWEPAAGSAGYRVRVAPGVTEANLSIRVLSLSDTPGAWRAAALGLDTTAAPHPRCIFQGAMTKEVEAHTAELGLLVPEGFHQFQWITYATVAIPTWYGSSPNLYQAGMIGTWEA